MTARLRVIPFLAAALLCACTPEEQPLPRKLVVDGYIGSSAAPQVCLTWTLSTQGGRHLTSDVADIFVHDAKVIVSDGSTEVYLVEMYAGDTFPQFYYTTGELSGEAGKTYTLRVETPEAGITASTSIPAPITLDSLVCKRSEAAEDMYSVVACFTVPPSAPSGMCRLFVRADGWYMSSYGTLVDLYGQSGDSAAMTAEINGDQARVKLMPPTGLNSFLKGPYFSAGQTISVRLCTMDADSFHYWADWEDTVWSSEIPIVQSSMNIRSNIEGGLGHWSGYGISRKIIAL